MESFEKLLQNGLNDLIQNEEALKFFRKNKVSGLRVLFTKLRIYTLKRKLLKSGNKMPFLRVFAKEAYMGIMLKAAILDMQFNLDPTADVYSRENKEEEEAISCVEALARVPQQVIKWGHVTTMVFMSNLYKIYYGQVIPSLVTQYEKVTSIKYKRDYTMDKQSILFRIKQFFKTQPKIIRDI